MNGEAFRSKAEKSSSLAGQEHTVAVFLEHTLVVMYDHSQSLTSGSSPSRLLPRHLGTIRNHAVST